MGKLAKAAVVVAIILALGGLANSPGHATVSGDINAGLPLTQVISNGQAAGMSIDAILDQALDAGVDPAALVKAAIAQKLDLSLIFKALNDKCSADPKLADTCAPCILMKAAVDAGIDMKTAANAMMAAGGNLQQVRDCPAGMGYPNANAYAYNPPAGIPPGAPVTPGGVGPTFPGGGGGGGGGTTPPPASPTS